MKPVIQKKEINPELCSYDSSRVAASDRHISKSKLKLISSKNKILPADPGKILLVRKNNILSAIFYSLTLHISVISILLYVTSISPKSEEVIHMITFEAAAGSNNTTNNTTQKPENTIAQTSEPEALTNKQNIAEEEIKKPEISEKIKKAPAKPVKKAIQKTNEPKISPAISDNTQQNAGNSANPGLGQSTDSSQTEGQAGNYKANASYDSLVLGRLIAAKRYPERARRRGLEGEIILAFSINRDGTISNGTLFKQSDSEILNQEAIDMLNRAAPFPQPPVDYLPGKTIEYKVPIKFALN